MGDVVRLPIRVPSSVRDYIRARCQARSYHKAGNGTLASAATRSARLAWAQASVPAMVPIERARLYLDSDPELTDPAAVLHKLGYIV